jgi:hypothetical protein
MALAATGAVLAAIVDARQMRRPRRSSGAD